jgi:hypothetical protein
MRARRVLSAVSPSALAALLSSCAYVSAPLPPSLLIPLPVVDLSVAERGDKLVIEFTAPAKATDNAPLRTLKEVDLRIGAEVPAWESTARRIETTVEEPGPARVQVAAREWIGQEILVKVRTAGRRGRFSEWSNALRMKVLPPLEQPSLKAVASAEGVRLTWTPEPAPATEYRVMRLGPVDQHPVVIATVKTAEFADTLAEFGKHYQYAVQSFVKTGGSEAESEMSNTVAITPVDIFPPAVPAGLTAIAGTSSIELSWNPDTEPDLRGYHVFRATGSGPFDRIGELVETPAYSDHAIQGGKQYRYQVSAVDQIGNESQRSGIVAATAP